MFPGHVALCKYYVCILYTLYTDPEKSANICQDEQNGPKVDHAETESLSSGDLSILGWQC